MADGKYGRNLKAAVAQLHGMPRKTGLHRVMCKCEQCAPGESTCDCTACEKARAGVCLTCGATNEPHDRIAEALAALGAKDATNYERVQAAGLILSRPCCTSSSSAPDLEPEPNQSRRDSTDSARRPGEKVLPPLRGQRWP